MEMKNLKPIRGRKYILGLISQGENECQDFKYTINDARKIARSLSAFSNYKGGRLLVGVKDNGVIAGVKNEEDIFVIEQAAQLYCRPAVELDVKAFSCGEEGIVMQVSMAPVKNKPVYAQEDNLKWKAYYRVADENIAAHPLMVRGWRKQSSDRPSLLSLDGIESVVLNIISQHERLSLLEIMKLVPASKRTIDNAIATLYSLSLIEFKYVTAVGYVITTTTPI